MKFARSFFILVLLLTGLSGWAAIKLPSILASGMVLQQQSTVNIWGWAKPGEKVTVTASWLAETVAVVTGDSGKWLIRIPTGMAGGPHSITIQGENMILLKDILFGEVWVCSGQSNMEFTIRMLGGWKYYKAEKKYFRKSDYRQVRLCHVKPSIAEVPTDTCTVTWQQATPGNVADFSATAWFFGRCLFDWLKVPIGLISSSIGGTPAEAWTDRATLEDDPVLHYYLSSPNGLDWDAGRASVLYNAMIHPLINYRIRGVIWYQGETNIYDADLYGKLFPSMIGNWRNVWKQGDFPFYFVQIAPFEYKEPYSAAAYLREAQTRALSLPNTGMVVTMDIGNPMDIHPKNKPEAGQRLALLALARTYGKDHIFYSGPVLKSVVREERGFRVFYDSSDRLVSKILEPAGYAVAGKDGHFRRARASVERNTVVITCDSIADPEYLRYAFTDADSVNLFNQAGLPAAPFRTDSIPLFLRNIAIDIKADTLVGRRYINLSCPDESCHIHYTLDGGEPTSRSPLYEQRILLNRSVKIRARAFKGGLESAIISENSYLQHQGVDKNIAVKYPHSPKYKGGMNALLDGIRGSDKFSDRHWQGYPGVDFEGVIDLGEMAEVDSISLSFLQDRGSWIFLPVNVEISTSVDGINFLKVADFLNPETSYQPEPYIRIFTWNRKGRQYTGFVDIRTNSLPGSRAFRIIAGQRVTLKTQDESETAPAISGQPPSGIRYIKVFAKNIGHCPRGHPGAGEKSWLFTDEIIIWNKRSSQ